MMDHDFSYVTLIFPHHHNTLMIRNYQRDIRKIIVSHRKINLSSLIIVGFQKFWMFSKVESTCVTLAHKPLGEHEILFKKFSNENTNLDNFLKISSFEFSNFEFCLWNNLNFICRTSRISSNYSEVGLYQFSSQSEHYKVCIAYKKCLIQKS